MLPNLDFGSRSGYYMCYRDYHDQSKYFSNDDEIIQLSYRVQKRLMVNPSIDFKKQNINS